MPPAYRATLYPSCLLLGTLLTIIAAVLHPDLSGDGADQLGLIARSVAMAGDSLGVPVRFCAHPDGTHRRTPPLCWNGR